MEFKIGDRIVTIVCGELVSGTIKELFPIDPPVCIVKFEDGSFGKIPCNEMALEPKSEPVEEKNEPITKSEITITPDEFENVACRVIARETKDHPIIGFVTASIISKIHEALFTESSGNDNFLN